MAVKMSSPIPTRFPEKTLAKVDQLIRTSTTPLTRSDVIRLAVMQYVAEIIVMDSWKSELSRMTGIELTKLDYAVKMQPLDAGTYLQQQSKVLKFLVSDTSFCLQFHRGNDVFNAVVNRTDMSTNELFMTLTCDLVRQISKSYNE